MLCNSSDLIYLSQITWNQVWDLSSEKQNSEPLNCQLTDSGTGDDKHFMLPGMTHNGKDTDNMVTIALCIHYIRLIPSDVSVVCPVACYSETD